MLNAIEPSFHILLVEQSAEDARELEKLVTILPKSPFRIAKSTGRLDESLQYIQQQRPDLVLLALTLPDSEGAATFTTFHTHAPDLPVIVLSESNDEELALQTVKHGAQDYLVKGQFDAHLLIRSMRYAIERNRTEMALARERNLLSNFVENIPVMLFVKDAQDLRMVRVNKEEEALLGYSRAELIGKSDFDLFPADEAKFFVDKDREVLASGQMLDIPVETVRTSKGPRLFHTKKIPILDSLGRPEYLLGISEDITELKRAEDHLKQSHAELSKSREDLLSTLEKLRDAHQELRAVQLQLIDAEKMKSIGRLAAGVAHEVKNPLAIMLMGLQYLEQLEIEDEAAPSILKDMTDALDRADSVIRGLLDFSAPQQLEADDENLNEILENALLLVRGDLNRSQIRVVKELASDLPLLKLDRPKIGQVFVNVFTNAVHAMPPGGTLTTRTYLKQLTGVGPNIGDARSESFRVGQTLVVVEIDDTGHGLPEDTLHKVFEPFFTTKATGKGTGLGLSVTKTIIDLHGGTLSLCNLPDHKGARVTIVFGV
ncbi:MAG: PAS domain-containing protein [Verrucomicrobiota bacterium]